MTLYVCLSGRFVKISTHILTKRMTRKLYWNSPNFTFQLTSSRRGWQYDIVPHLEHQYFNSHPHEEDDETGRNIFSRSQIISTHILTKRMTTWVIMCEIVLEFQLTSSRRGWQFPMLNFPCIIISTHILTKRMTRLSESYVEISIFQLTSSRRGWQS